MDEIAYLLDKSKRYRELAAMAVTDQQRAGCYQLSEQFYQQADELERKHLRANRNLAIPGE